VDQKHAVLMVMILGGVLPAAVDFFNVLNDAFEQSSGMKSVLPRGSGWVVG
jgi:hypothetical protein